MTASQLRRLMRQQAYWRERERKQRELYIRTEAEELAEINRLYDNMYVWAEREVNAFYGKYADKSGIDIVEAKQRVSKVDIAEYERMAKQMVKDKDFSDEANEAMRLYNATMRINRLEMLKSQIGLHLVENFNEIDKHYEKIATERAMQEHTRMAGILGDTLTDTFTAKNARQIVNATFYNATFSQRIWEHQSLLKNALADELQKGLIAGIGSRQMATNIRKQFDVSRKDAERLMATELRRVQTDVAMDAYKAEGITQYEYMAVNPNACPLCKSFNGKIYEVKGAEVGNPDHPLPPMHPRCHCTTAPWQDPAEYEAWLNWLESGGTTAEWDKMTPAERAPWGLPQTDTTADTLRRIETESRNYDYEVGAIVDDAGNELLRIDGGKHEVQLTDAQLKLLKGNTFTHNHPNGGFITDNDILTGFVKGNLKELRASTPQGIIHVITDNGTTDEQRKQFLAQFRQARQKANRTATEHFIRQIKAGELTEQEYKQNYYKLYLQYQDEVVLKFVRDKGKEYGFTYREENYE